MKFSIRRFRRFPELKACIVNLKSGTVFRAVIWQRRSDFLILRNAEILQDRGERISSKAVDGELLVLLSDLDFLQVL